MNNYFITIYVKLKQTKFNQSINHLNHNYFSQLSNGSSTAGSSSSGSMIFFTCRRKSSRPRNNIVSVYPRSTLQLGQHFVRASVPEYHLSTQMEQPRITLQHLATMAGGRRGTSWHILQPNVSLVTWQRERGNRLLLGKETRSWMRLLTSVTSVRMESMRMVDSLEL